MIHSLDNAEICSDKKLAQGSTDGHIESEFDSAL